ncbi:MAG: tetratricopeptide repeat protein, partial [Terriglobia bacterium]
VCDLNSWGHQFVMDDLSRIVGNPLVRDPQRIPEIFLSPYHFLYGMPSGLYRPLTTFSFAMNSWITGMNPDGFHLVNRALHVLSCLGIFWILRRLLTHTTAAFFTSLLFAVHPIQTEAITYIDGRSDALVTVFFIFGWLFFIHARRDSSGHTGSYVLSLAFYYLALLSKESAITWLGIMLLTELVYYSRAEFKIFWLHFRQNFLKIYAGYFVITLVYLAQRLMVLKQVSKVAVTFLDNPLAHVGLWVRVLTATKILFQSLGQLLCPVHLSADYSYNQIPLIIRGASPAAWIVPALTAALIVLVALSYRRAPNVFFGVGFFLITYSIVSNFPMPIGTIRADRLLYLPSVGILLVAGIALSEVENRLPHPHAKNVFHGAAGLLILALAFGTMARNRVWLDEFTLYRQTVLDAPRSAKSHNNLGAQYFARNEMSHALEQYRLAEGITADYPDLLSNIGSLLSRQGEYAEAVAYLNRAIALSPQNPEIRNNLGLILRARGDLAGAIAAYDKILEQYPSNADAHFNKANALVAQKKIGEAIQEYNRTLEIDPNYNMARTNLDLLIQRTHPTSPGSENKLN